MKHPLWYLGVLCIVAGTVAVGIGQSLFPSLSPQSREERLGMACAQIFFIFVGLVLILVHFIRRWAGKRPDGDSPRTWLAVVRCPDCQQRLRVSRESLGKTMQCNACNHRFMARAEEDEDAGRPSSSR